METKIAFFDIDGTLLDVPRGLLKPSPEVVYALNEFKRQGHKIVIATARGIVPESLQDIAFDGYICSDGHYITYDGETIVNELFSAKDVQKQCDVYARYHGRFMFNGHGKTWSTFFDDPLVQKHQNMFQGTDQRPKGAVEVFESPDVQAVSCCVLFETTEELWSAYHELKDDFTIVPYDTGLIRMDVYCQGFTKGTACEFLYQRLGLDYQNTYAFGDGVNDIEMLELVKHGIAMGNAVESLKAIASEVTASVDCQGIAQSFEKHFNIRYSH